MKLWFLPVVTFAALGQSTASLHGHVTDPSGAGVAGAVVALENPGAGFRAERTTGADGAYSFVNLPLAAYLLTVRHPDFAPAALSVNLRSNVAAERDVVLGVAGARVSIAVSDAPPLIDPSATGTIAQVNQAEIERIPAGAGARGLEAALVRFPGFAKNANGAIHPRGAHNQITFVVDGMPISDQLNGAFANTLDPAVAQSVELYTGNIPAEYFGKVGAVVNVTTRSGFGSGRRLRGHTALDAGQFDLLGQTTQAAGEAGRWGYSVSLNTMKTHRFLDQVSRENLHNGGNSQRGFARVDYRASARQMLRVTTMAGRSSFELANLRSQHAAGQRQRQALKDASVSGGWVRQLSPRTAIDASASFRTAIAQLFPSPGDTPVTASQWRRLSTATLGLHASFSGRVHTLRLGGDYQRFPVRERFAFAITSPDFNPPEADDFNPNLLEHDLTRGGAPFQFSDAAAGALLGLFLQDTVRLGPWTLALGLRYDRYRFLVNAEQWQPRIGAAYAIGATGTVLRVSYNRTFQTPPNENLLLSASADAARLAPPAVQRIQSGGPAPLRPERQNVFEAGFQQAIGRRISLNAAFHHKNARDQQDNNNFLNTGIIFPITLRSIRVNGAEARLNVLPLRGLSGSLALTHARAVSTPPFTGGLFLGNEAVEALSQGAFLIDHDQFLSLHGTVQYEHRAGWWIAPTVRYDSGLVANPSDPAAVAADPDFADLLPFVNLAGRTARVRPRTITDLAAGYLPREARWEVSASVGNLTNRVALYNFQSIFVGTRLVAPRTATVRLKLFF
jgi:outer membrane cobalamin receptor